MQMGNLIRHIFGTILFIGFLLSLTFCETEDHLQDTGELGISLSTNQIEEPGLESIIIAIKGIDVRSPYSGWIALRSFDEPVVLDMLDLNEGETFLLADNLLPSGIYTEIRLQLEMENTYLQFQDGRKVVLKEEETRNGEYKFKGGFKIPENKLTELILKWNFNEGLKKSPDSEAFYLNPTFRSITKEEAATIKGKIDIKPDQMAIKVYAVRSNDLIILENNYLERELFNSVSSSKVKADGDFIIPFLNRGVYNLIFIGYDDEGNRNIIRRYEGIEVYSGEEKDLEQLSIDIS